MSATKPLAILLAVLVAATGVGAAAGSTYDTGDEAYAMDAQLDDGVVTVTVTADGEGVGNVTVEADGEDVGATDADGTVSFERPDDEFEVSAELDGAELESEYAVDDGSLVLDESEFEMDDEDESDEEDEAESDEAADESEEADDADEAAEESDDTDEAAEESDDADRQGPPSSLPSVVPDRVSALLGSIFGDGGQSAR
jgi:hypothetical protein